MIMDGVALVSPHDIADISWADLRRFHNVNFVADLLARVHQIPLAHRKNALKQAEQIKFCLLQAREYFSAAQVVSLATKPTLLYYSVMCLALAELLFKQSGNSSLDRAREQHRHHGLELRFEQKKYSPSTLDSARTLRAAPLVRSNGDNFGTFALWHNSAREYPLAGEISRRMGNGSETSFGVVYQAADINLERIPRLGLSLLDCLVRIPSMGTFFRERGMVCPWIRAHVSQVITERFEFETKFIFHPGIREVLIEFFENIRVCPRDFEEVRVTELERGAILSVCPLPNSEMHLPLPHATTARKSEVSFWVKNEPLNEFGFIYVALFIAGTYARYFPDLWMRDVEQATELGLAVERLLAVAEERAPLLALSELSGKLHIPDR